MIDFHAVIGLIPQPWQAALTSTSVLAIIGTGIGFYFREKLRKTIQHNLDVKLESVRAEFRQDEAKLRAELQLKGEQIAALRSGALSGLAGRYAALDKRRLEAADILWGAVTSYSKIKAATRMLSAINMEKALPAAARQDEEGEKIRKVADVIWQVTGLQDAILKFPQPHTERLFVPPIVWALYSTYVQILSRPILQLVAMRTGTGQDFLVDPQPLIEMTKTALPHRADSIDKLGADFLPSLADEIEEKILKSLASFLEGAEADVASLKQAADILKAADELASQIQVKIPDEFAI